VKVTFKTVFIPSDGNADLVSFFQFDGFEMKEGRRLETYVNVRKMYLYVGNIPKSKGNVEIK
jgi:hypothetical protein